MPKGKVREKLVDDFLSKLKFSGILNDRLRRLQKRFSMRRISKMSSKSSWKIPVLILTIPPAERLNRGGVIIRKNCLDKQ